MRINYLLDTDTLIYWMKGTPQVVAHISHLAPNFPTASVISKAELYFGAYNSKHVDKNVSAVKKLAKVITFVPVNDAAQELFGKTKALLRKQGTMLDDADILIAATALAGKYTLVTNNSRHFERIPGLTLENWLEKSPR